jgi:hypothetical protein
MRTAALQGEVDKNRLALYCRFFVDLRTHLTNSGIAQLGPGLSIILMRRRTPVRVGENAVSKTVGTFYKGGR